MSVSLPNADVDRIRALIEGQVGVQIPANRVPELVEAVHAQAGERGMGGVEAYVSALLEGDGTLVRALAERLTVGETYFFRNGAHLQAFLEVALPEVVAAAPPGGVIRVLSAGCASGEEPYSLAMLLADAGERLAGRQVEIHAFDVNTESVERARRGLYSRWSLRQTPEAVVERWFRREGRMWRLSPEIRAAVQLHVRNLVDDDPGWWHPSAFDVIFCRNVVMYFSAEVTRAVVARFSHSLEPHGYLFMGHAEPLRGLSDAFHLCCTHETFYYSLRGEAASEPVAPPTRALPPLELPPADDTAWMDLIQASLARITDLSGGTSRPASASREIGGSEPPEELLAQALKLTERGAVEEAEAVLRRLMRHDDLSPEANHLMALCREHAGDTAGAIDHARRAAYLDPRFAMPQVHLGRLARRAGREDEARRALLRAIDLLEFEDSARLVLYGGGFGREALIRVCRQELERLGRRG